MNALQTSAEYSADALYELLASQVESYQKSRHLQNDTSISQELAKEFLESIVYTLQNVCPGIHLASTFTSGQAEILSKVQRAEHLLTLVEATWDGGNLWFWDVICDLRRFMQEYDPLHLAHRRPLLLSYPLLCWDEAGVGIDYVLHYIHSLWAECQILNAFDRSEILLLMDSAPPDYWAGPQNSCEQPLCNALGRILLGYAPQSLRILQKEFAILQERITQSRLEAAGHMLCKQLNLSEAAEDYALRGLQNLFSRILLAARSDNLSAVFLGTDSYSTRRNISPTQKASTSSGVTKKKPFCTG